MKFSGQTVVVVGGSVLEETSFEGSRGARCAPTAVVSGGAAVVSDGAAGSAPPHAAMASRHAAVASAI